jgi:uncharacterized damage-inducible protein DinB
MNTAKYPPYFRPYIEKVNESEPIEQLRSGINETVKTLALVSDQKASSSYAEGKWTIKEVVQHLIDTERIFVYRALTIARGEKEVLQGYDHEKYAISSLANKRSLKSLLEEFKRVRLSSIDFFESLTNEMRIKSGKANGFDLDVEQFSFIIIGHELHHVQILNERYL